MQLNKRRKRESPFAMNCDQMLPIHGTILAGHGDAWCWLLWNGCRKSIFVSWREGSCWNRWEHKDKVMLFPSKACCFMEIIILHIHTAVSSIYIYISLQNLNSFILQELHYRQECEDRKECDYCKLGGMISNVVYLDGQT